MGHCFRKRNLTELSRNQSVTVEQCNEMKITGMNGLSYKSLVKILALYIYILL